MWSFARAVLTACACWIPCHVLGRPDTAAASRQAGARNVHLIQHSHDDPGWLKTVDQYHYGSNNSIQVAGTAYILDSVIAALEHHPDRTFTYAETAFLMRWWREQHKDTRSTVRRLVAAGQLSFVNGGYVQNDEASAHYVDIIDQTTLGHRFLAETFGKHAVPRVGWQIDPFGHSSTQAVLSALYGFDAQFFARADYQDMERRASRKELEMLWRGSPSAAASSDVFTGNFPSGNYGPPSGFNWDWGQADPQIQDDRELHDYNVDERVAAFVAHCEAQFNVTRGNDIMLTMGADFTYANAHPWFKNLDKLIRYVNKDGRFNVFYSTPEAYVKAKHSYNKRWPLKTDDFFPYADCPHCYWTGYFSSRPTSKGYIRTASSHLQSVRQLEVIAHLPHNGATTAALWEAVALAQHHDAVTGTAKQHVADDYAQRIAHGMKQSDRVAARALSHLIAHDKQHYRAGRSSPAGSDEAAWEFCHLANISVCGTSVGATRAASSFSVALWNPLPRARRHHLRIPIAMEGSNRLWSVTTSTGGGLQDGVAEVAQVLPISQSTRRLQDAAVASAQMEDSSSAGDAELVVTLQLPPLGLTVLHIRVADESVSNVAAQMTKETEVEADEAPSALQAGGGTVLHLEGGRIARLQTPTAHVKLDAGILVYNSSDGGDGSVPSGAYIFRPNGSSFMDLEAAQVVKGNVVSEVRSSFHPWVQLTVRAWSASPYLEVEWTVGPIPFQDGLGREVAVQYGTDLDTGRRFSTDSNGREMQPRVRDERPTWTLNATHDGVAANYYPLTTAAEISEAGRGTLSVIVDRAQGGSSLQSGQLEVVLHRRVLHDDWRGVGEPLNETACGCRHCSCDGLIARGTHILTLEEPTQASRQRRRLQQEMSHPPLVAFRRDASPNDAAAVNKGNTITSDIMSGDSFGELPDNVQLLTLQRLSPDRLLLRLAHMYQEGEHATSSKSAKVDLTALLQRLLRIGRRKILSLTEYNLSGSRPLDDVCRLKWQEGRRLSLAVDVSDTHRQSASDDEPFDSSAETVGSTQSSGSTVTAHQLDAGSKPPASTPHTAAHDLYHASLPLGRPGTSEQGSVNCEGSRNCANRICVQLDPMQIRTWVVRLSTDVSHEAAANISNDGSYEAAAGVSNDGSHETGPRSATE